jgi:hypothetical protein
VSKAQGGAWRDVLAALPAASTAVTGRFGMFGVPDPVTVWQLACLFGWSAPVAGLGAMTALARLARVLGP